ncbi:prepilin-type N-terminal cleavage/methylation domain-containing protein [bacterium]|nr:prepilin-type N-terminal cleavage/methylation domain-containing protein [bacterium]
MSFAKTRGFTLIELLIVVAIIAILAAIAVPNFLEAQVRAKVSRTQADMRSMALGVEAFRVDNNKYPEGTDNADRYPETIQTYLGALAPGYYTFRSRGGGEIAGKDFATLTTPVAYVTTVFLDPFVQQNGGILTYSYRDTKDKKNGYIITSFGPDSDALSPNGKGTLSLNPLGTQVDTKTPSRMGDVNERAVIAYMEATDAALVSTVDAGGGLRTVLSDLAYDPTNGTISDGDIYRVGP